MAESARRWPPLRTPTPLRGREGSDRRFSTIADLGYQARYDGSTLLVVARSWPRRRAGLELPPRASLVVRSATARAILARSPCPGRVGGAVSVATWVTPGRRGASTLGGHRDVTNDAHAHTVTCRCPELYSRRGSAGQSPDFVGGRQCGVTLPAAIGLGEGSVTIDGRRQRKASLRLHNHFGHRSALPCGAGSRSIPIG